MGTEALHSCMSTQRYHENFLGTNPTPPPAPPHYPGSGQWEHYGENVGSGLSPR